MMKSMDNPMTAGDSEEENEGSQGYSVVINCYADGTHDVFQKPLEAATEEQYPDGLFGLENLEDALRGVIALKKNGPDYSSAQDAGMMKGYGGVNEEEDE